MKTTIKKACFFAVVMAALICFTNVVKSQKRYDRPADMTTSATGFNMKAKIDDKEWVAKVMMPDFGSEKGQLTVSGQNNEKFIGFMIPKSKLKTGSKMTYNKFQIFEMGGGDSGLFYTCDPGTIEVIKNDGKWLEGHFHFKAAGIKHKYDINGTFRVAAAPLKK